MTEHMRRVRYHANKHETLPEYVEDEATRFVRAFLMLVLLALVAGICLELWGAL